MDVRALAQLSVALRHSDNEHHSNGWNTLEHTGSVRMSERAGERQQERATRKEEKLKLKQNSIDKVIMRGDSG